MAATPHDGQRRQRRTSAFAYVCDRSVGLGARRFCDELYAEEARAMAPVTRNFIYWSGMKAWTMEIDPVDDRYLLVGSANSNIMLFDLHALGDSEDGSGGGANNAVTTGYDTSNPLPPICCVRARSIGSIYANVSGNASLSSSTQSLQYGISAVDWYPVDAGIFVSSSLDGHVKVWDSDRFDLVSEFALQSKVFCAKFSRIASQHSLIAAVTEKGEVRLCDMAIESSIHSLLGHQDEIWSLAWSPENEYQLCTGSRNGEIRMWDIRRSGSTACLLCLNHEGKAVVPGRSSVHTNIKKLPAMSLSAASKPVSRKRRRLDGSASGAAANSNSIANENRLERERKRLTSASPVTLKRNDPHAAASVSFATAHRGGVSSLVYTPDGRFLLSSGNDQKLRLWNSKTGEHAFMNYQEIQNQVASRNVQIAVIQEADPWDSTLVFHPNGRLGELNAYQVFGDHGMPLMRYTAHYQQITACVYRKSTRELYTGGEDGIIMKWRPTPVNLCPERSGDDDNDLDQSASAQLVGGRSASRIVGAADGDVDAWSDDEAEQEGDQADQGDIFIPPILRQYEDEDRH